MRLRDKLLLAQLPLALALILVGVMARRTIDALDRSSQEIMKDNHQSVLAAQRMRDAADALVRKDLLHEPRGDEVTVFERELQFQETNITEPGERETTQRLRTRWERLKSNIGFAALVEVESATDAIAAINQDAMIGKSERTRRRAESMNGAMLAVTIATFLVGILASGFLTARLTRPLFVLSGAVRRLGEGDALARARVFGSDEIAQLAMELNTMAERLAEYRRSSLGDLLAAQQSSQAAIDSLPDPVLVLRGSDVVSANRAALDVMQVDVDAGDGALARVQPVVRATIDRLRSSSTGSQGLEDAFPISTDDGPRYFLARATQLSDASGIAILFQDVTKLRRFDELKTDLVATVAHEVRTPLTSLRMAVHLCLDGALGPLTEKQADLLFAAREDCERLQGIVDDLLDVSRVQAGRIDLHRRAVSARVLVEDAVHDLLSTARERNIDLERTAIQRAVDADPERARLVIGNLVGNALRYAGSGARVTVGAELEGDFVRFEVRDDGPGIDAASIPRLFERFYRVPGTPQGGAGLGLYICKEIVEAHGGRIGVTSVVGAGSTFWFTLPLSHDTLAT